MTPIIYLLDSRTATTGTPSQTLNSPSNSATGVSTTPALEFTGVTSDGYQNVSYEVQVDTVNTFNSQGSGGTYAFVQNSNKNSGTISVIATFTSTPTAGNLMLASVGTSSSTNQPTLSDANGNWTLLNSIATNLNNGGGSLALFGKIATVSQPKAITAALSGAAIDINIYELSGNNSNIAAIVDMIASASYNASVNSSSGHQGSVTTTYAADLVFTQIFPYASGTSAMAVSSGTTQQESTSGHALTDGSQIETSTGTYNPYFTWSGSSSTFLTLTTALFPATPYPLIDAKSATGGIPEFVEGKTVANATGVATTPAFTNAFAVGQLVAVTAVFTGGANATTSVTDSAGNVYTLIPGSSIGNGLTLYQATYYAVITNPIASPTVTVNFNSAATNVSVVAQYFNGFKGLPTLDQSTAQLNTASTTCTSGASGATGYPTELVIGVGTYFGTASTFALGSGYTNLTSIDNTSDGSAAMESKVVSSTGAQTATFTLGASLVNTGGVLTFYDSAVGHDNAQFADVTNPGDTDPFPSGDQISYTVPSAEILTASTTYYWRTQQVVPVGNVNYYSGWSSIYSFTTASGGGAVNASVTQVGATLTFTGGTQVVATVNDVAITQTGATLTFTGGTQAVASVIVATVSQSAATLTFTGGTQAVATVNIVAISQSAATLTFTGGTQSVASIRDASISQVGATLTLTGGTQSVSSVNDVSVAQSAATLTFTGGTQSVATVNIVSISQVGASLTFTGGTQSVVTTQSVSVSQVGATLTFTGGTQATALNLPQSAATLTFTGGTQAVASVRIVSVSQSAATLTFSGGTQAVATVNDVAVSQVGAVLTFTGGTQSVSSVNDVSISQVGATLTFNGGTQSVSTVNIVAITQSHATLTLTGGSQGVQDIQDSQIAQVGANLTLSGGTQAVATINDVSIPQTHATLTLTGGTQSVATVNDVAISQVGANLTLTGGTQSVVAGSVSDVSITQVGASLTFTGGSQGIQDIQDVQIAQAGANLTLTGGTQSFIAMIDAEIAQRAANLTITGGIQSFVANIIVNRTSTWTPEVIYPDTWSSIGDPNPDTWLVNPQGPIDTWDNPNREWDSTYTWDGTTSQVTNAIISSWTGSEAVASNWQSEPVSTSSWTEV